MEEIAKTMMRKKRSRVFDIDDGGSFDRLLQESRREVFGCNTDQTLEAEATNLLQLKIVEGFLNRLSKDTAFKKTTTTSLRACQAFVDKEKRKKTIKLNKFLLKRKPEDTNHRCDDNVEENIKKKAKKMRSDDNNDRGGMMKKSSDVGSGIIRFDEKGLEPPKLSSDLEKRIAVKGGSDIKLVIMKKIFESDLKKDQARLSIPFAQIRDNTLSFLTQDEKTWLENYKSEMPVMLMEPCKDETSMVLTRWSLKTSYSFVLRSNWNKVLQRNHFNHNYFKLGDVIQVWSFRVGPRLWFAIDKVWDAPSHISSIRA